MGRGRGVCGGVAGRDTLTRCSNSGFLKIVREREPALHHPPCCSFFFFTYTSAKPTTHPLLSSHFSFLSFTLIMRVSNALFVRLLVQSRTGERASLNNLIRESRGRRTRMTHPSPQTNSCEVGQDPASRSTSRHGRRKRKKEKKKKMQ